MTGLKLTLNFVDTEREAEWKKFFDHTNNRYLTKAEIDEWHKRKRAEGKLIDPDTAKVFFDYTDLANPYNVYPGPSEYVGRSFFAVAPGSTNYVFWSDLPPETCEALADKREAANVEGWRRVYASSAGISAEDYKKMTTEQIDKILAEKFPASEDYKGPAITDIDVVAKVTPQQRKENDAGDSDRRPSKQA